MKKIGLIGGISPTSTKLYYERIISSYYQAKKTNPEIIIYSVDLQKYLYLLNTNKNQELAQKFLNIINSLKKAGADFVAITAVSMHVVMKFIKKKSTLPIIDGIYCLVKAMVRDKKKTILLLGTDYVMKSKQFKDLFESQKIEVIIPSSIERSVIESIIKTELNRGIVKIKSKKKLLSIIKKYTNKIDCICLACTALPSILSQSDFTNKLKVYDFIESHIKVIVKESLK